MSKKKVGRFQDRRKNTKENLKITEEFAGLKGEMANLTGKEMDNFNSMVLLGDIFHDRCPVIV